MRYFSHGSKQLRLYFLFFLHFTGQSCRIIFLPDVGYSCKGLAGDHRASGKQAASLLFYHCVAFPGEKRLIDLKHAFCHDSVVADLAAALQHHQLIYKFFCLEFLCNAYREKQSCNKKVQEIKQGKHPG